MSQSADRITYLLQSYLSGTATVMEKQELMNHMLDAEDSEALRRCIREAWELSRTGTAANQVDWDSMFDRIINEDKVITMPAVPGKRFRWWARIAAAILLLLLAGSYFTITRKDPEPEQVNLVKPVEDIQAPTTNKATITFENGNVVALDSMNGLLAEDAGVRIVKLSDGRVVYQNKNGETVKNVLHNTLHNPKGSRVVDMTLTDGSRVWLNAGSSITYPVVFTGEERSVSVKGEAYFEVKHDAIRPFKVHKNEVTITVLGTRFNVSAYEGEPWLVTLLQGSVKVNKGITKALLKPGQQADITSAVTVNNKVNTEAVMAWKQGYFELEGASVKKIMNQLSRWYDVPVVYDGVIPERKFGGQLSHTSSLSDIIKILQAGNLNIQFNEGKIIVGK